MLAPLFRGRGEAGKPVEQPLELTAAGLWREVAGRLQEALNEATYRTWFGGADGVDVSDDTFFVSVPNDFTREWIEGHFLGLIRAALRDATGHERRVHLTVRDDGEAPQPGPVVEDGSGQPGA